MRPGGIKRVDNRRGANLRDPRCRCVRYNRPETSKLSVFGWRGGPVVSDPRKDAATENQVCIRKQNRGENRRPDTSMCSVSCWRKAGASSARSKNGCGQENQRCGQPKGVNNERPDTMVRVWQREKCWVASDPRKDAAMRIKYVHNRRERE
jgi:hypothetical protein